jgi:transcription initiation factor TFIIB
MGTEVERAAEFSGGEGWERRLKRAGGEVSGFSEERCCPFPLIVVERGHRVCRNCSTVLEREIVAEQRRAFSQSEVESRRRTEVTWRSFGERTVIPTKGVDARGNRIPSSKMPLLRRLSKINASLVGGRERNLWTAEPRLKRICAALALPDAVSKMAWKIYVTCKDEDLLRGRGIDQFVAAAVYAAVRICGLPRVLDDVKGVSEARAASIQKALRYIVQRILPQLGFRYRRVEPRQLIFRFGEDLGIGFPVRVRAWRMLDKAFSAGASAAGRDPSGFAAAALYLSAKSDSGGKRTQREIAETAGVTEVTLRSRVKEILGQVA